MGESLVSSGSSFESLRAGGSSNCSWVEGHVEILGVP